MSNHPEAALRALAEHGLRCDMNPTHDMSSLDASETFWHGYLRMLDANVRQLATNALAAPSPPDSSQGEPVACPFAMPVYVEDIRDCGDGRGRYTAFKIVDSKGRSICDTLNADVQCIHEEIDADEDYSSVNRWDEDGRKNLWFIARIINSYTTPPPSSPQVADGYAIVPIQPTQEMLTSAGTVNNYDIDAGGKTDADHIVWWKDMIAAAPQSAPKAADDEPLFTVSMYGTAAAADKAREEWLAAKVEPQWQPMDSAPHDITLLGVVDGDVRVIRWCKTSHVPIYGWNLADQGVEEYEICEPTCWMYRPAPPRSLTQADKDKTP
jgi:hypothetical protein